MANIKNITVVVGEYEKNGEKKPKHQKIGVLIEKEDGKTSIKLDEVFTNYLKLLFGSKFEWRANVYENTQDRLPTDDDVDSDLPF